MRFDKAIVLACGLATLTVPTLFAASPTVHVDEAWIRWLPGGIPSAGYATLTNSGDKPVTLIAAKSSYFKDVSVHRSINRGGTMQMLEIKEITIAPHKSLEFASLGYHLMLMQPTESIEALRQIPVVLMFADGSSLTASFEVRKAGGASTSP